MKNLYSNLQIRYDGDDCRHINFSYHVAFASIFFLLALTSLIQLAMCIHAGIKMTKSRNEPICRVKIIMQNYWIIIYIFRIPAYEKTSINITSLSHHNPEIFIFCRFSCRSIAWNVFCCTSKYKVLIYFYRKQSSVI